MAFAGTGFDRRSRCAVVVSTDGTDALPWAGLGPCDSQGAGEHERDSGSEEIWLRVFDWNAPARHLYLSHGYELVQKFATDAHLRKRLVA